MLQRDQHPGEGRVAAGAGDGRVEALVHEHEGAAVAGRHGALAPVEGLLDLQDVVGRAVLGGQGRGVRLEQGADLERLAQLHQVERRDGGAGPGATDHQPLQGQPPEGVADARQAGGVAPRQPLFVQPRVGRELTQDDVEQDLLVDLRLLQFRRPVF